MTRATNARIAGFTFLLYIAAGIASMVLFRRATGGEEVAARLAAIAEHATDVGVMVLLGFVQFFSALVLGVTLWAITRDQDNDLAMLGLPIPLAWLGVAASVLLVVCLPLRLAGFLHGPMVTLMWLPMLAFEVPLGLWLLTRGVAAPTRTQAA
jgi:hypothetical protein